MIVAAPLKNADIEFEGLQAPETAHFPVWKERKEEEEKKEEKEKRKKNITAGKCECFLLTAEILSLKKFEFF